MKTMDPREADEKVLAAVRAGRGTLSEVCAELELRPNGEDRIADRALQRLRKAGRIVRSGRPQRWEVV